MIDVRISFIFFLAGPRYPQLRLQYRERKRARTRTGLQYDFRTRISTLYYKDLAETINVRPVLALYYKDLAETINVRPVLASLSILLRIY